VALGASLPSPAAGLEHARHRHCRRTDHPDPASDRSDFLSGSKLKGRQRLVVAAYGVRGIGSIYDLGYAGSHLDLQNEAELWATTALAIVLSTVLHGFTAAFAVDKVTETPSPGCELRSTVASGPYGPPLMVGHSARCLRHSPPA